MSNTIHSTEYTTKAHWDTGTNVQTENATSSGDVKLIDQTDAYTKLLLHMDGNDGSVVFTDECGKTITPRGTAQIDTAQFKWNQSGLFDGNSDWVDTLNHADYDVGAGDFTEESWVRFASVDPASYRYQGFFGQLKGGSAEQGHYWYFDFHAAVHTAYWRYRATDTTRVSYTFDTTGMAKDTWYHFAVVRNGTNFYIFRNGVPLSLTAEVAIGTKTLNNCDGLLWIGKEGNNFYLYGWMDEVRWSKGIARWTADFSGSLPSAPYTLGTGYNTTGSWESPDIDRSTAPSVAGTFNYQKTEPDANHTITAQYKQATTQALLAAASYANITTGSSLALGNRWAKYKFNFVGNGTTTPTLSRMADFFAYITNTATFSTATYKAATIAIANSLSFGEVFGTPELRRGWVEESVTPKTWVEESVVAKTWTEETAPSHTWSEESVTPKTWTEETAPSSTFTEDTGVQQGNPIT